MWLNILYKCKNRQLINLDRTDAIQVNYSGDVATLCVGIYALLKGNPDYIEKQYGKILLALKNNEPICNIYEEGELQ